MFKIPNELLAKMLCRKCKQVILCSPVYSGGSKFGNVCSKCYQEDPDLARNYLFENIAELFLYPCKENCMQWLPWGKSTCPKCEEIPCLALIIPPCKWRGPPGSIYSHFQQKHPKLIAFKQKEIASFITPANMIMNLDNINFVIHIHAERRCKTKVQITLLEHPELVPNFQYHVEINYRNPDALIGNAIYISQLNSVYDKTFSKNTVVIDKNKNMAINIKRKDVKCLDCNQILKKTLKNYDKSDCKHSNITPVDYTGKPRLLNRCFYTPMGCRYVDIADNLKKHAFLFCEYFIGGQCSLCGYTKIDKDQPMFSHIGSHYTQQFDGEVNLPGTHTIFLDHERAQLRTKYGNFLCRWSLDGAMRRGEISFERPILGISMKKVGVFSVDIVSNLPHDQDARISFTVMFKDLRLGAQVTKKLVKRKSSRMLNEVEEWHVEFDVDWSAIYFDYLYHSLRITLTYK